MQPGWRLHLHWVLRDFFAMQRPDDTPTHADQPGRVNSGIQQVSDLLIVVFFELCLWERNAEASREERHLEVNCELATRSRHSQRSLTS